MASPDEPRDPTPNDPVLMKYHEMARARSRFDMALGTEFERAAQEEFHDAVFRLYNSELSGRLKHRDEGTELWEEAKLWRTGPVYLDVALCPGCTAFARLDEDAPSPGEPCPNCGNAVLEQDTIPKTDEDGEVVFNWVRGLKELKHYRNKVETETIEYSDALGKHEETVTQKKLLGPRQLESVADLFGEAMEILGLFPDAEMKGDFEKYDIR